MSKIIGITVGTTTNPDKFGITEKQISEAVNSYLDENPIEGDKGKDGASAYEIALINGFEGSEEEWLESLKGEKGERGEQGEKGDSYILTDTDKTDIANIVINDFDNELMEILGGDVDDA
jgi:hypothetical protein